jgi:ATP-dependent DNA helicase MPH1
MSEGREDMNWESAQQTHREIQEEILHSRNLELFEDVEPLLIPGHFPKCVEQEMPVDPWDPSDQKLKKRLPGSQADEPKSKTTKKPRGHEIPDDAHDGFMSVSALLKGKGKGKKRARSPTPVQSDDDDDNDHDEEAENALLFGSVKATTTKSRAQAKGKAKGLAKKAEAVEKKNGAKRAKAAAVEPKETKEEKKKRLEREEAEETNRMAIDFFNTYGPIRRRAATPPATPPSSSPSDATEPAAKPSRLKPKRAGFPPSPISDESLTKSGPCEDVPISPRTAALAGFSQLDAIDLSWDDDEIEMIEAGPSRPTKPPLVQSHSTTMMPPPPIPTSRPSVSPAVDSPFNIRPGARRPVRDLDTSPVLVIPSSESPVRSTTRNRNTEDSSPLVPQRRPRQRQAREHRRPRANREAVNGLVSIQFKL